MPACFVRLADEPHALSRIVLAKYRLVRGSAVAYVAGAVLCGGAALFG